MTLGAITNDGHGLAVQQTEIGVGVVKELGHPGRACGTLQWTSLRSGLPRSVQASFGWEMTRSIRPYSLASSALRK